MTLLDRLVAAAYATADPRTANEAIAAARDELEQRSGQTAFSYELFVPTLAVDAYFLTQALPKLVRFLHDRGVRSATAPGVFVSLFTPDTLCFISMSDALELFAREKGVPVEELFRRYAEGGPGEPLRLGTT